MTTVAGCAMSPGPRGHGRAPPGDAGREAVAYYLGLRQGFNILHARYHSELGFQKVSAKFCVELTRPCCRAVFREHFRTLVADVFLLKMKGSVPIPPQQPHIWR